MSTLMALRPGHTIVVAECFGLEPIATTTQDTVAYATKHYVITVTGIFLTEADRKGVRRLQEFKLPGFYISAKAQRMYNSHQLPLEAPYLSSEER